MKGPALALLAVLALGGCSLFSWQSSRYGGETSEVYFVDAGRSEPREISYTLNLGDNVADVYFAFVNYGEFSTQSPSVVPVTSVESGTISASPNEALSQRALSGAAVDAGAAMPRLESQAVSEANNGPLEASPGSRTLSGSRALVSGRNLAETRASESVGTTVSFFQYDGTEIHPDNMIQTPATLRKIASDNAGMRARIWVEDDLWHESFGPEPWYPGVEPITQEHVDELAAVFLTPGDDNDIHDWVTGMIGEPWGEHDYGYLISDEVYGDTIDILLVDILQDGEIESGIVGYFFNKDTYEISDPDGNPDFYEQSNERIMFYVDGPMYAQTESGAWSPDDPWPELVFSTLAHELQHMIHYYQKRIVTGSGRETETWLNELLSLVVEDLVSHRLDSTGPRGVDPEDYPAGTAGSADNTRGWLGIFNANNDIGIYEWDGSDPGKNYAVNYAFGAFLARNYGGVDLVRETVRNSFTGVQAIEEAFGWRPRFRDVLSEWAAAVLTSDEEIDPAGWGSLDAVYNPGEWVETASDSTTFRLGSINLYNHTGSSETGVVTGPRVYPGNPDGTAELRPPGSVIYYQAADNVTGRIEWDIALGATTDLVVVAKAAR